jgi:hypothetical protein
MAAAGWTQELALVAPAEKRFQSATASAVNVPGLAILNAPLIDGERRNRLFSLVRNAWRRPPQLNVLNSLNFTLIAQI